MVPDPHPNLPELEAWLASRPGPEPSADLRQRLLGAMADARAAPPQRPRWRYVWRAAAAAVLVLNLSMSAANGIRFQHLAALPSGEGNLARVPDTFETDDRFRQLAASALATLSPAPDVGSPRRSWFTNEERREWDMP